MQYRHVFHAGNFADVHKHVALLQLVAALGRKAKGFLYLDTHGGEGLYDLASPDSRHGAESAAGIMLLEENLRRSPVAPHGAIRHYVDTLDALRRAHGGRASLYPGSPLLAASQLRAVDQLIAVESQSAVARALQRALDAAAPRTAATTRVIVGDGYQQLKALLPPPQRRGLVLIDPPYESPDEEDRIAAGLAAAMERFETGVYALWYPIKRRHDSDLWLARILRNVDRPQLVLELCRHEPDNTAGLNGSGLLILNPPWQFDEEAGRWQEELHALLGGTGGSRVHWLRRESAPGT